MGIEAGDDAPTLPHRPAAPQARAGAGAGVGGGTLPRRFSIGGGLGLLPPHPPPPLHPLLPSDGAVAAAAAPPGGQLRRFSSSTALSMARGWNAVLPNAAAPEPPKITVRVHRHLADQHLFGSPSVNDEGGTMVAEDDATSVAVAVMRSRCARYQERLDALLKTNFDANPFQECLLDFWDELFPATAGIHFYNQQSPVPRMSHLHTFLTSPCPKAIGTIQCEIERVRVTGKGSKSAKRVKGRFFPIYEYRLFIRDTRNDHPYQTRYSPRKDSVLLVAKNKRDKARNASSSGGSGLGRGHGVGGIDFATPAGLASPTNSGTSKRGLTNYYMCLPQKVDVDNHYKSANKNIANADLPQGESSGMALSPLAVQSKHSVEIGRLQSNFIGTEFQIFIPTGIQSMKISQSEDVSGATNDAVSDEDGALEGCNRVHPIDTMAPAYAANSTSRRSMSRRGSDFVRLARRASLSITGRGSSSRNIETDNEAVGDPADESDVSRHGSKKVARRMSWGHANSSNKRKSRRAIANNSASTSAGDLFPPTSLSSHPDATVSTIKEVENGAITYTANLLGNRPRIMDVCIPKLMENGGVCEEWLREQDNAITSCDGAGNIGSGGNTTPMLDRFKTILSLPSVDDNDPANINRTINNHGLMLLQNRPR
ncbi:hypothetical protein ACHAW5_008537 [Stephanodiscus triporus]|uniref:RGS domain-containing protein n=1 Tax=Stephanodiscus triporus TaxID=2934178 RepID=A0ABD3NE34_9STRA